MASGFWGHCHVQFRCKVQDLEKNGAANGWPQRIWKVVGGGSEGVPVSKETAMPNGSCKSVANCNPNIKYIKCCTLYHGYVS